MGLDTRRPEVRPNAYSRHLRSTIVIVDPQMAGQSTDHGRSSYPVPAVPLDHPPRTVVGTVRNADLIVERVLQTVLLLPAWFDSNSHGQRRGPDGARVSNSPTCAALISAVRDSSSCHRARCARRRSSLHVRPRL